MDHVIEMVDGRIFPTTLSFFFFFFSFLFSISLLFTLIKIFTLLVDYVDGERGETTVYQH